jgi:putative ABC transport system substrate-binding protein
MIRRREFITLLGGAAVTWPIAALAQQAGVPVIGYLSARSASGSGGTLADFKSGLAESGYIEGQNVAIEYRWAEGRYDTVPALVADLVRRRVAVVAVPNGTASVLTAKTATQTIPIVFSIGSNPVEIGLVPNLNHPGGNLTGVAGLYAELAGKRLELLHELVPSATSIAFLVNPNNPVYAAVETKQVEAAARAIGVRLLMLNAGSPTEIDEAFATLSGQQAGALLVGADIYFLSRNDQIMTLAAAVKVAAVYAYIEDTIAGGLISYGERLAVAQHMVGVYTGRILKGEKPADLPIQQVTKVELAINMKTARALSLDVPPTVLARADEVIE